MKASWFVDCLFGDYVDYELERDGIAEFLDKGEKLPELEKWIIERLAKDYDRNDAFLCDFVDTIGKDHFLNWIRSQNFSTHTKERFELFIENILSEFNRNKEKGINNDLIIGIRK